MSKSMDNMLKELKDVTQESTHINMVIGSDTYQCDTLSTPTEQFISVPVGTRILRSTSVHINPKEYKSRKAPLDLVPPCAIFEMARAFGYGADKYGRQNWVDERSSYSVYYAAMMRHLLTWFDGEEIDEESGVSHLAHIMANCAILIYMKENNNFDDDRIGNKDLYK